ncbi:WXG100 family type VII secretion target [Saccharomonospora sp. NPDC046836]|uniref:WXG100 family type VII secretion target n=1 Tax=Saccharomonospora sp. NPDC046836 TaxID=3156921 RepID=UPI0033D94341
MFNDRITAYSEAIDSLGTGTAGHGDELDAIRDDLMAKVRGIVGSEGWSGLAADGFLGEHALVDRDAGEQSETDRRIGHMTKNFARNYEDTDRSQRALYA